MTTTDPWLDPAAPPDEAAIRSRLGTEAGNHWSELAACALAMGAKPRWRWDGARSGWVLVFLRAGRSFLTLSAADRVCQALVVLGRAQVVEVETMPLGHHVRGVFDAARQYPDGRWVFVPVQDERDIADVASILATKLPPTVRARLAAGG